MAAGRKIPWYLWPLIPIVFVSGMIVFIPLSVVGLISIPYFCLFPERHRHQHDFTGTPRQQEILVRWRRRYAALGAYRRVQRAIHNFCRRSGQRL